MEKVVFVFSWDDDDDDNDDDEATQRNVTQRRTNSSFLIWKRFITLPESITTFLLTYLGTKG